MSGKNKKGRKRMVDVLWRMRMERKGNMVEMHISNDDDGSNNDGERGRG